VRELSYHHVQAGQAMHATQLQSMARPDERDRAGGTRRVATFTEFYTANASIPLEVFRQIGGFNKQGFRCHDIELAARLVGSVDFVYEGRAFVVHLEHTRSIEHRVEQAAGLVVAMKARSDLHTTLLHAIRQLKSSYLSTLRMCQYKFLRLVRRFTARVVHDRTCFLHSHDTVHVERLLAEEGIEYRCIAGSIVTTYQLRLDRNCWDFEIVVRAVTTPATRKLTIVIPTFNESACIGRCLASLYRQDSADFEILVVNDGSSDSTVDVATSFSVLGSLRIVCRERNGGLAQALNTGLAAVGSEYLLHLDADDELLSGAITILENQMKAGRDAVTFADDEVDRNQGLLFISNTLYPRLYKTETLRSLQGWRTNDAFGGRYAEDRLMLHRIDCGCTKVEIAQSPIARIHRRQKSLSRQDPFKSAAAKLGIFAIEAGAQGRQLIYQYKGRFLSGAFRNLQRAVHTRWSVILPFRSDPFQLDCCLESWQNALTEVTAELFVVVDGCDLPQQFVSRWQHLARFIFMDVQRGPAAARNIGAHAATNEYLFFSDADHIVAPHVLSAHCAAHASSGNMPTLVLTGLVRPKLRTFRHVHAGVPYETNKWEHTWLSAVSRSKVPSHEQNWLRLFLKYGPKLHNYPFAWSRVGTGSMSILRESFEALGSFDENLWFFEDWDFAIRFSNAGGGFEFCASALALHQEHVHGYRHHFASSVLRFASKHPDRLNKLQRDQEAMSLPEIQDLCDYILATGNTLKH
jgi:glycosyltransferase involved in cell wall biosynthesis